MGRRQYLAKNTALFALNTIGTKLINFLLVPIYTAVLTTSEYGTADLVSTIVMILVPFLTLNINEAVMRFCLDEKADYNKVMSSGLAITVVSIVLGLVVVPGASLFPAVRTLKWYISGYCITHGVFNISVAYLRGKEMLSTFAISNLLQALGTTGFNILFLIVLKLGLPGYFLAHILGYVFSIIYALFKGKVFEVITNFHFDIDLTKKMVAYSIVLVPTSFMWWIMNSSDRLMITAMVGAAANGVYAISYKVPTAVSAMSTVFNQAWSYSAIKEDKSSDREAFNNKMFDKLISFQVLATSSLIMVIKPFLKVYVNDNYYSAWKYTPYLLVGFFFMSLGTFLSTSYTVNKDSKGFLFSGMTGAILNLLLNWVLIPSLGVTGAALATCISYISVFAYRVVDTRKYLFINIFKPRYLIGVFLMVLEAVFLFVNPYLMGTCFTILVLINIGFIKEMISMLYRMMNNIFERGV